ncbi:MAG: acyltransferase [Clostridia bacterium]|nr:acyltransferase [Clostridia bacterium]
MMKIIKTRKESIDGYIPALDALRAVCTILIFAFHNWQQTWLSAKFDIFGITVNLEPFQRYGYIAIEAFFVMSGFGLFYPIARNMFGESKPISWKQFYIKRLRRILPSYYFMLLLLLVFPVLSYNTYNVHSAADVIKHFGLHALFLHNCTPSTLGSVISTAWTLGIEAAFYLVFPIIASFFRKSPSGTFGIMLIIGHICRLRAASKLGVDIYVMANPLLYTDVFGWGMFSAYCVVYVRNRLTLSKASRVLMTAASLLSLVGVYYYMIWMGAALIDGADAQSYHRLLYRTIPSALFALFIFSASYSAGAWQRFLGNRFFAFVSAISYSFYLWHQNIHIVLKKLNIPPTTADPVMNDKRAMVIFLLLSIALSLAAAVISTYLIERPIVKYGFKGALKRYTHIKIK